MPYVRVVQTEGDKPLEVPAESDSSLLLSTLQAAFPRACGLVYKHQESGAARGVRLVEDRFHPPEEGWGDEIFLCTMNDCKQETTNDDGSSPLKKTRPTSDLIILGLPWKTTEEQVKKYFESFGEVTMVTIKKNLRTGESKGFGFVRFAEFSSQAEVIGQRHMIDGRWCDVKIPYSQEVDISQACKIFVGQLKVGITQEAIKDYFSNFGDVTDIYIPQPFRQFAFVTFADPFTAKAVCATVDHSLDGSPINVSVAIPQKRSDGSPFDRSTGTPQRPAKRKYSDRFEENDYFNNSGEWNAKQGRNSLLWDESSWDIGHYSGYTTGY